MWLFWSNAVHQTSRGTVVGQLGPAGYSQWISLNKKPPAFQNSSQSMLRLADLDDEILQQHITVHLNAPALGALCCTSTHWGRTAECTLWKRAADEKWQLPTTNELFEQECARLNISATQFLLLMLRNRSLTSVSPLGHCFTACRCDICWYGLNSPTMRCQHST